MVVRLLHAGMGTSGRADAEMGGGLAGVRYNLPVVGGRGGCLGYRWGVGEGKTVSRPAKPIGLDRRLRVKGQQFDWWGHDGF